MSSLRQFSAHDLFGYNNINLDHLTETYNLGFYFEYLAKWPDYFLTNEAPNGALTSYIMGKAEAFGRDDKQNRSKESWHGHVTAVTVDPDYRRLGFAKQLMDGLERTSEETYDGVFVDLFVRASNDVAIGMYKKRGYSVYRRVLGYYSGGEKEDAFDMRKALKRDAEKKSIVPLSPLEVSPASLWDEL